LGPSSQIKNMEYFIASILCPKGFCFFQIHYRSSFCNLSNLKNLVIINACGIILDSGVPIAVGCLQNVEVGETDKHIRSQTLEVVPVQLEVLYTHASHVLT
jgi:hypothetical protein